MGHHRVRGMQIPPLFFDVLEPRYLLNADVLGFDIAQIDTAAEGQQLLVRMVDHASTTAQQAETVQRVEIVDLAPDGNGIVAMADLNAITRVAISGGAGDDMITIDHASFGGAEVPEISFAGGDGTDQLALLTTEDSGWQVAAGGSGNVVAGTLSVSFADIEELVGAADTDDTFTVSSFDTVSLVDGGDRGFDSLIVDVAQAGSMAFTASGPQSGTVVLDGVALAYEGLEPVELTTVASDLVIDLDLSSPDPSTLDVTSSINVATLRDVGGADGRTELRSDNASFESPTFVNPTNSLTIKLASGNDELTIEGLDAGFAADFKVEGGSGTDKIVLSGDVATNGGSFTLDAEQILGGSTVKAQNFVNILGFNSWGTSKEYLDVTQSSTSGSGTGMTVDITTNDDGVPMVRLTGFGTGYSVGDTVSFADPDNLPSSSDVTVEVTSVASGTVQITTSAAGQDSGNITFTGENIALGPNVTLDATAIDALNTDGTVKLEASASTGGIVEDIMLAIIDLPVDFSNLDVGIDVAGATIKGGDISLSATAEDVSLASEVPTYVKGFAGNLEALLDQIPGITNFLGIDISVGWRGADAEIFVSDATIEGRGDVSITSETKVESIVNALAVSSVFSDGFQLAAGFARAVSDVTASVTGETVIETTGNVDISATGKAVAKPVARSSNLLSLISGDISGEELSVAIAIANTELDSLAKLGRQASIVSTGGNVNVISAGTTETGADASINSFVQGRAGISGALSFDFSTSKAIVDGTIDAEGSVSGAGATTFNPSNGPVDFSTDTISIADHGFETGQKVVYTTELNPTFLPGLKGKALGGLEEDGTYYVIKISDDEFKLATVPPIELDGAETDATSTHSLTKPGVQDIALDALINNEVRLPGHGFEVGDQITYSNDGNGDITGLSTSTTYTVLERDDEFFSLTTDGSNPVTLGQGSALGTHTFTRVSDSANAELTLAAIDETTTADGATGNIIRQADHGFTEGQRVFYSTIGDIENIIGGLERDAEYSVDIIDTDSFRLREVDSDDVVQGIVDISVAPGANTHAWVFEGMVLSFNPNNIGAGGAVDADQATIRSDGHGLTTGDTVIYRTDPNNVTIQDITIYNDANDPTDVTISSVEIEDQEIRGLLHNEAYYVVRVDANHVRLVEDPGDAVGAGPIDITDNLAFNTGTTHTLSAGPGTVGIGVHASLEAKNKIKSKPEVGGKFNASKFKDAATKGDVTLALLFGGKSVFGSGIIDKAKSIEKNVKNDSYSVTGNVGFQVADHDVEAVVGKNATAADRADLDTRANVDVTAFLKQTQQNFTQGSVSKPKGSGGGAVAMTLSVALVFNDNEAAIGSFADVDADGDISVDATLEYPFITEPIELLTGIPAAVQSRGVKAVTDLLDGTLGVATKLFNTWVSTNAKTEEGDASSIAGSIALNVYDNNNRAVVKTGANVNQNTTFAPASTASVDVSASTTMKLVGLAGIGKFSLNEGPFGKARFEGKSAGQILRSGDLLPIARSDAKALGGSVLVDVILNDTDALIEAGASVRTGASGSLNLTSKEDILRIAIAEAGGFVGDAGDSDGFAFAGSANGYGQDSITRAGILSDSSVGATTVDGGGNVNITADANLVNVGIAGSITVSEGGDGVGISVLVNEVNRDTVAFIGTEYDATTTDPNAAGATSITAGAISLDADTRGGSFSFTIAGTVRTSSSVEGDIADPQVGESDPAGDLNLGAQSDALDGAMTESGFGVAGSASINLNENKTLAYIADNGTMNLTTLSITADDASDMLAVTGSASVNIDTRSADGDKSTSVAGVFALNNSDSITRAFIDGATVNSSGADVANTDEIIVDAHRDGFLAAFAASFAVDTNSSATAFSGSIAINRIDDETEAVVDNVTITAIGDMRVQADNDATMLVIGVAPASAATRALRARSRSTRLRTARKRRFWALQPARWST